MQSVANIIREEFPGAAGKHSVTRDAPPKLFLGENGADKSRGRSGEWLMTFRWREGRYNRVDWTLRRKDGTGPSIRSRIGLFDYLEKNVASSGAAAAAAAAAPAAAAAAAAPVSGKRRPEECRGDGAPKKKAKVVEKNAKVVKKKVTFSKEAKETRFIYVRHEHAPVPQKFKISDKTTVERMKKHVLRLPRSNGYNGVDLYDGLTLVKSLDGLPDGHELQARVFITID